MQPNTFLKHLVVQISVQIDEKLYGSGSESLILAYIRNDKPPICDT